MCCLTFPSHIQNSRGRRSLLYCHCMLHHISYSMMRRTNHQLCCGPLDIPSSLRQKYHRHKPCIIGFCVNCAITLITIYAADISCRSGICPARCRTCLATTVGLAVIHKEASVAMPAFLVIRVNLAIAGASCGDLEGYGSRNKDLQDHGRAPDGNVN